MWSVSFPHPRTRVAQRTCHHMERVFHHVHACTRVTVNGLESLSLCGAYLPIHSHTRYIVWLRGLVILWNVTLAMDNIIRHHSTSSVEFYISATIPMVILSLEFVMIQLLETWFSCTHWSISDSILPVSIQSLFVAMISVSTG